MWRSRSWTLVLAGALSASSALADVIWIGQPTLRDYMAYNVQKAIEGFVQMREQMAQFEAQVTEARRAYFAAPASNRGAAGDRFGQMLFEKDLMIAWPKVIGTDEQGQLLANFMALANNGRPPDGGIAPSARQAFNRWVSAIRFSTGGGFGSTPDPVKTAHALQSSDSMKEYEAYRRLRDQAEWDDFEAQRSGGARRLLGPGTTVSPRTYFGETPFAQNFDARIARLPNKILQCLYAGRQAEGSVFHFWQGQPPEDIAFLMAMNMSAFTALKDHALDACPPDSKQASAIASSPAKVVITPQMAKDARAQKNSMYVDPAQAEANRQRNEAARAKSADRKSLQEEKSAMFRTCADEMRANIVPAQQARDNNAIKAVHARYMQCMSIARAR
ncbi:hypothetical protein [Variovorax brevis]|uniref:hypothetical protein n=1 Tax=Variovorax brevis TaxID=3053503 RepID=UPI002577262F|nr:hypothetical protein [Variovorax sp. J22R133]